MNFFPPANQPAALDGSIYENLDCPRVVLDGEITDKRQDDRKKDSEMWKKRTIKRHPNRTNETNVFKRRRSKTRIHSTK